MYFLNLFSDMQNKKRPPLPRPQCGQSQESNAGCVSSVVIKKLICVFRKYAYSFLTRLFVQKSGVQAQQVIKL